MSMKITAKLKKSGLAMRRLDDLRVAIDNPQGVDVTLFANPEVSLDDAGVVQLGDLLRVQDTLATLRADARDHWDPAQPVALERVVLTPDFHKGGGIPVGTVARTRGFVLPQAVGHDVCCGMRLLITDLTREEVEPVMGQLMRRLRGIFFEGQRDIPMSARQREALLRDGLWGLSEVSRDNAGAGLWRQVEAQGALSHLDHAHGGARFETRGVFNAFADYLRAGGARDSRDSQIGSVGGGNHFVELQEVERVLDGATARAWGVRPGALAIMAHSGSVSLGHVVGAHFNALARDSFARGVAQPKDSFAPLFTHGPHAHHASAYLDAMRNAANFAFGNRLFLGLMMVEALRLSVGREVEARLVHDAPHNLIWEDGPAHHLHRKGACPALGPAPGDGPYATTGSPVIIPGSMGAASYLMAGQGAAEALCSACHGAGRMLTRGRARHASEDDAQAASRLRVVTPIDPDAPALRGRRDVLAQHHARLMEEAPHAYKPLTPIIDTIAGAEIARPVARLWPLLTVKG